MSESSLPPRPVSQSRRVLSAESDLWAGLFLDLSVRIEWLGQALDAIPKEDASAAALVRLNSYAKALHELHNAIAKVHAHRSDARMKPLFSLEGPLAGYLSRLFAWTDEIGDDFERMAVAIRRKAPTSVVFSHRAVNESYAQFDALVTAMRRSHERAHADLAATVDTKTWRAFDEHLEELVWSTEWVHMTLARAPGE